MKNKSSLIEEKVVMMPKLIPTNFEEIKVVVPTKHEFIYGKYVPVNFKKTSKVIPTDYEIIEVPRVIKG